VWGLGMRDLEEGRKVPAFQASESFSLGLLGPDGPGNDRCWPFWPSEGGFWGNWGALPLRPFSCAGGVKMENVKMGKIVWEGDRLIMLAIGLRGVGFWG